MRILVVEDDPLIALLIEDALVEAGHQVVGSVSSSSSARRLVEEKAPDLMFVDIHLIDGETGCTFAREAHDLWNVPTIFVTGSPEKARTCDHAIGVITKPFRPESIPAAASIADGILAGKAPTHIPAEMQLFEAAAGA